MREGVIRVLEQEINPMALLAKVKPDVGAAESEGEDALPEEQDDEAPATSGKQTPIVNLRPKRHQIPKSPFAEASELEGQMFQ